MSEIIRKLLSRKLWVAVAGIASGVAMALGAESADVATVTGAVTALVSAVTYIVVEGKVDAERVKTAVVKVQEAAEVMSGDCDGEQS